MVSQPFKDDAPPSFVLADYYPLVLDQLSLGLIAGVVALAAAVVFAPSLYVSVPLVVAMWYLSIRRHAYLVRRFTCDDEYLHISYVLPQMASRSANVSKQHIKLEVVEAKWIVLSSLDTAQEVARLPLCTARGFPVRDMLLRCLPDM